MIYERGDKGDSLLVIISGKVKIFNVTTDAREVVLNFLGPGDVNGEIAVLDGRERTATAMALEPSVAFVVYRRDLMPLLAQNPETLVEIVQILCDKLRATSEIVEDSQRSMRGRAARGLLRLARQHGKTSKDGIVIDLGVNQRDLGNYLALSRENTSRQLGALTEAGIIATVGGQILIRNEAATHGNRGGRDALTSSPPRQSFDGRALVQWASAARRSLMRSMRSRGAATVLAIALGVMAAMIATGTAWFDTLRERTFDTLLAANVPAPRLAADQPIVVDIDRASLGAARRLALEPRPAGRTGDRRSGLSNRAVVAIDILLDGADEQSPAALARKLARMSTCLPSQRLATTLPDGDARLPSRHDRGPDRARRIALDPERETPIAVLADRSRCAMPSMPTRSGRSRALSAPRPISPSSAAGIGALVVAGGRGWRRAARADARHRRQSAGGRIGARDAARWRLARRD